MTQVWKDVWKNDMKADQTYGDGSSLRIGSPEFKQFDNDATRAARLMNILPLVIARIAEVVSISTQPDAKPSRFGGRYSNETGPGHRAHDGIWPGDGSNKPYRG